ncbi:MAG: hypothetical protein ABJO27_20990 [Pseudoruegeria sp.]
MDIDHQNDQDKVPAKLRRADGRLLIVAFEGDAPEGWREDGARLTVFAPEWSSNGVVLPVGSSNRVILRMEESIGPFVAHEDVVLSYLEAPKDLSAEPLLEQNNLRLISEVPKDALDFSIVTLMRTPSSYNRMLRSYAEFGFTEENTEFIAIDNRDENIADGYLGARLALTEARGTYLIFCHDDIELIQDSREDLLKRLAELEKLDPKWMAAGVAGGVYKGFKDDGKRRIASRISDRWGPARSVLGPFPRRVESLDECFLLAPRRRFSQSSVDLGGFHFFGTDLCLQAELAGGSAYVIDFHMFHYGKASKGPAYRTQKKRIEAKYRPYFPGRIVTTCTKPLVL